MNMLLIFYMKLLKQFDVNKFEKTGMNKVSKSYNIQSCRIAEL